MQKDYTQRNFTIKAVVLALILAMVLAAANVYLALKIATTISASIPAAVISIGVFRLFKRYSVYECNLVQTAASAGEGMASAIAFILPAMIILHFWAHFDYWLTTIIAALGGVLGVFLAIPLRRVLLNLPNLKFPEGTAIGNVLKVTAASGNSSLVRYLFVGVIGGGLANFLQQGVQMAASIIPLWMKTRGVLIGTTLGFDPAVFAAGFIIGPEVCFSLFIGVIIGWDIIIPWMCHYYGIPAADNRYDAVMTLWDQHLRYVGVGTMLVGGVWTLTTLIKPIIHGIKLSLGVLAKKQLIPEHERDIPMIWMGLGVLIFAGLIFCLLAYLFEHLQMPLGLNFMVVAMVVTLFFIMFIGFVLATICGYVVGVVGSTNSPMSGMIIIAVILLSLTYLGLFNLHTPAEVSQIVELILLVATLIGGIAVISTENMQDLKAGQMIGATPWKQQIMLALGVVASSFVLAPVLELLYHAYGIGGVFPRPGMDTSQMLAAPQAAMMATIASGIMAHNLNWTPILIGAGIAVLVILFDELVCRRRWTFRISIMALGLSIYLPPEVITGMVIGGFLNLLHRTWADRYLKTPEQKQEAFDKANLTACGLVAGSALMGVILAIPFALSANSNVLTPAFALNPKFSWLITATGIGLFVVLMWMLDKYRPRNKKT